MSKVMLILKGIGLNQKNASKLKIAISVVVISLIFIAIAFDSYSEKMNKGLAENLIRLHVIANSDSDEDQALKRNVRDVIINYMKDELKDSKDLAETKQIVAKNLNKITELAKNQIEQEGKNYNVDSLLGNYPFPTKAYGDITLPAGNYEALRVVIGKGEGANWWCVLFPPLCFVDATHGTVSESVKNDLKKALSEEEYEIITNVDNDDDIPVEIKFKVVEFFQSSKIKFTGMVSKIFRIVG